MRLGYSERTKAEFSKAQPVSSRFQTRKTQFRKWQGEIS
jgi:hypothetical protein